MEDDSSSLGYRIDVYQESINQTITEYLINFDYFERVLFAYGFKPITHEEAKDMGLPEGTGMFSELFRVMEEEIKINKFASKDYGNAPNMKSFEKDISFLNRYFVYKKFMEVVPEKVEIELGEYRETQTEIQMNNIETQKAINIAKDENAQLKPKIKKLSKKLLLVPATEATDEKTPVEEVEKAMEKPKKAKRTKTEKPIKKPALVIESDED